MSLYYQLLHLASNRNFCCQYIWFVLDVIDANKSAILFYSTDFTQYHLHCLRVYIVTAASVSK